MLRKGALESGLGEIMLTVLVAAVISGAMFGPLGAKVGEGFREAEKFTDITTTVEVENPEVFGSLSKYVFFRAWGCSNVESESFSGLTSTSLTNTGQMPCASAGGTLAAGGRNLYTDTGGDMEGKFGRIDFVINDTFTLNTGEGFGPDDKAAVLAGVSTGEGTNEGRKTGYSDWIWGGCTAYDPVVSDSYMSNHAYDDDPPHSYFTLFFKNGGGGSRVTRHGNGITLEDRESRDNDPDPIYCNEWNDGPWLTKPVEETGFPGGSFEDRAESYSTSGSDYVNVRLCEGDQGYIEVRKGYPNTEGESTGSVASNNNNDLYGMIQITNMNESC